MFHTLLFVVFLPKYARVNTLLVSVADVILLLRDEKIGHVKYDRDVLSFEEFLAKVQTVRKNAFIVDYHFPDILVFNPNQPLYSTKAYKQGFINISDKASCFPVRMLDPKPGCIAMDACAAPGMKTCHMATLMQNKGQIFASDWKANRVKTMETILSSSGVTCCEVKCQNFLRINPFDEPYNSVQYALVDPSCSSSGMVGRLSELLPDLPDQKETKEDKIKKLAHFQIAVLKHAMSFPNIKRIAYSTCSINVEENEMVVETVLSYFPDQYEVVDTFPNWPERGDQSFEFGCKCVRAYPKKHLTNGFFVAVLERVEDVPLRMVLPDDGGDIHSNRSKIIKIIKEVEIESNDEMECSQNLSPSMVKVESIDDGSVKSKLELSGDVESSKELENSSVSSTDIEALIISKKELQMKNQFVSNISNHTPSIQNITCIENSKIKKKMKNVINKKPKFTVTKMEWQ